MNHVTLNDIDNWFTYHPPRNQIELSDYEEIRYAGKEFALFIFEHTPPGKERNIAINKLREVVMWANAAIACNNGRTNIEDGKSK